MKKFLLYACVALISCIAFAQTSVVVVLKEGIEEIYAAADVDSIRINKNEGYDAVVVLKNGKEEKYAAKDIDSIKIEKDAPVPADETGLNFEYYAATKTASVKALNDTKAAEVVIPSKVLYEGKEYEVTSIGEGAFLAASSLTSIIIPNSVTSIGNQAFALCASLTSIEIPNSVTSIGERAFTLTPLTSIVIPESVTEIGENAFFLCPYLETARVPKGCEVADNAFPETCEIVWYGIIPAEKSGLKFKYGETTKTASVTGVENQEATFVEIPSKVLYEGKEYEVTSIGAEAFSACTELASVDIPESVTSIGENAFTSCMSLTSIEIPESVTEIGASAFSFCTSLTSIEIPSSITSIGGLTFFGCKNLKTARVPRGCEIADDAFPETCEIEWYGAVPAEETGLNFIYDEFSMTAGVTYDKTVGIYELDEVEIPSQVVYKGEVYDVISIRKDAFKYSESLTSIEIPESVTIIGDEAFVYCVNLTSIEIPSSVTKIGRSAFADCQNLKTARVPVGCELGNNAFPSTCEIVWYASADQTGLRFDYDQSSMTASVTHLYSYNEYYEIIGENYDFTEVKIPSQVLYDGNVYDVTSIRKFAFYDCTSLTSIEIPNSVTTIGTVAFSACTSLTSIVVDKDNKVYDSRENCNAIIETASNTLVAGCQNTVIPNSVTSIGIYAFSGCTSLTSIEIPESVTEIGKGAFDGCGSLTSIEIPESVTTIGDEAFYGCRSLTSIEIPESVTRIGYSAFADCLKLKTARVPKNCKYDSYSFPKECAIIKY